MITKFCKTRAIQAIAFFLALLISHLKYSDLAARMILWPLKWVFSTTSVMSAYSSLSTSSPKFSDRDTMWSTMPTGVGERRWWWSHIVHTFALFANTCPKNVFFCATRTRERLGNGSLQIRRWKLYHLQQAWNTKHSEVTKWILILLFLTPENRHAHCEYFRCFHSRTWWIKTLPQSPICTEEISLSTVHI